MSDAQQSPAETIKWNQPAPVLHPAVQAAAKPGWQTSEFWIIAATTIAGLLNGSGILGDQRIDPTEMGIIAGLAFTFAVTRSVTKTVTFYLHLKSQPPGAGNE